MQNTINARKAGMVIANKKNTSPLISRVSSLPAAGRRRSCEEIKRRCIRILQVKISEADAPLGMRPQGKPPFLRLKYRV